MAKKASKTPEWCKRIACDISNRTTSAESVVEAIMFDIQMAGEDYARKKWSKIRKGICEK